MVMNCFHFVLIFLVFEGILQAHYGQIRSQTLSSNGSGIEIQKHSSFNLVSSSLSDCGFSSTKNPETSNMVKTSVKLHLKHRSSGQNPKSAQQSLRDSAESDFTRIEILHKRILEKKNQKPHSISRKNQENVNTSVVESFAGKMIGTVTSGVTLGSGEYFMDVFLGTPPKHFSLIIDTGSDLNWIQCLPCYDCFEQFGPHYDPTQSSSYKNISCHDRRCDLVTSPETPRRCTETCPYFYWYGDSSNTTGDFATETFTINLTTTGKTHRQIAVDDVMFGCGHWNRGLFHGAAGLLGLGRGPLSFASQLRSLYGHSFSYCLVDRDSNSSITSKLIFGEDEDLIKNHTQLNYTSLIDIENEIENPSTFYYVQIKSIIIGGRILEIPKSTWDLSKEGLGGTIIDSGTTLSYFADPAYGIIKKAIMAIMDAKGFRLIQDFPILEACYNVSGIDDYKREFPSFAILFDDGAIWDFPIDNYFIKIEPQYVFCLAVLGTPRSALSIIGNYQQQNFHIIYDTNKSRLGYAPTTCADL